MHRHMLLGVMTATALAAGCIGGYSAPLSSEAYAPDLVYAAPGVQVIADYDQPIFYTDNVYWRYDGGTWYRSSSYDGGWQYATPPSALVRIDRPSRFAHYRPQGWVARQDRRPEREGTSQQRHQALAPQRQAPTSQHQAPEQQRRPAQRQAPAQHKTPTQHSAQKKGEHKQP
jgi:hypothetical protein